MIRVETVRDEVRRYFIEHAHGLSLQRQFRFYSRLWLWNRDQAARFWLDQHRDDFLAAAAAGGQDYVSSGQSAEVPELMRKMRILFASLFAETVFQSDCRHLISDHIDVGEWLRYRADLIDNPLAVSRLSTRAVNFLFLTSYFWDKPLNPDFFLAVAGQQYSFTDREHVVRCIYLLTHTIIAASHYYSRLVSYDMATLHRIMDLIEVLIDRHLVWLSLDIKFEYLVAATLLRREPVFRGVILDEALQSVSRQGRYLVDTRNSFASRMQNFGVAEHRNMLFLMVTAPYIHGRVSDNYASQYSQAADFSHRAV